MHRCTRRVWIAGVAAGAKRLLKFWRELLKFGETDNRIEEGWKGNELVLSAIVACGAGCVLLQVDQPRTEPEIALKQAPNSNPPNNAGLKTI
jgi:hypothetical protein